MADPRSTRAGAISIDYEELRHGQEEAVRELLDGRHVLAVISTGSGKSPTYQIAGLLIDDPAVAVSPLPAARSA